jgi:hypothetical protein
MQNSNLTTINNVICSGGGRGAVEEMANHFRAAAFEDGHMAWQGFTFYPTTSNGAINGWVVQLDDGRRFAHANLADLVLIAAENAALWQNQPAA